MMLDKTKPFALLAAMGGMLSGCGIFADNTRYYGHVFEPRKEAIGVCSYRRARVVKPLNWILTMNDPEWVSGMCGPGSGSESIPSNKGFVGAWRETDGGGSSAGTFYRMETLFPQDRENEAKYEERRKSGKFYAPERRTELPDLVSNGLTWEHVLIEQYTRYQRELGREGKGEPPPGPAVRNGVEDIYIYKHPDGWWLRIRVSLSYEMQDFPKILASRRDTLRRVVESVKIEPKDPSRVSCRIVMPKDPSKVIDPEARKGREQCVYLWP